MKMLFRCFSLFSMLTLVGPVSVMGESLSSLEEDTSGDVSYFDSETAASISAAVPVALLAGAGILVACTNHSSSSSSTSHVHAHTH